MNEPIWIDQAVVIGIHERQIHEHGGILGLRDMGLLASALARPNQIFAYGEPNLYSLAAAYTRGIIKNHPFVDGNKRTGFVVGILFLESNGLRLTVTEEEAARPILDLAAGAIGEADYAKWLEDHWVE